MLVQEAVRAGPGSGRILVQPKLAPECVNAPFGHSHRWASTSTASENAVGSDGSTGRIGRFWRRRLGLIAARALAQRSSGGPGTGGNQPWRLQLLSGGAVGTPTYVPTA